MKEQIALNPHTAFRGYQQLGANVTRYDGGFQRDWHEAIDLYKEEADAVRRQATLHPCAACSANLCCTPDSLLSPCSGRALVQNFATEDSDWSRRLDMHVPMLIVTRRVITSQHRTE